MRKKTIIFGAVKIERSCEAKKRCMIPTMATTTDAARAVCLIIDIYNVFLTFKKIERLSSLILLPITAQNDNVLFRSYRTWDSFSRTLCDIEQKLLANGIEIIVIT